MANCNFCTLRNKCPGFDDCPHMEKDLAACRAALKEAIGHMRFSYGCDLFSDTAPEEHNCGNCHYLKDNCEIKPILDKLWQALKGGRDD